MRRRLLTAAPFLTIVGCSALVQIDDEKYLKEASLTAGGGQGGEASEGGGTDSGAQPGSGGNSGGTGGTGGSGGTGGTGGSGGTGGTGGSGGIVTMPDPLHYWPLDDGNPQDAGSAPESPAYVSHGSYWRNTSGVSGGTYEVTKDLNDQYLGLQANATNANPATLSWWYISTRDGYVLLAAKTHFTQTAPQRGWSLLADNAGLHFRVGGGSDSQFSSIALPEPADGEWTHVAVGYHENISGTQDEYKIWVNGELLVEKRVVFNDELLYDQADVRIGFPQGDAQAPASHFTGLVDEVRFYDRVLTDDEVMAIYEQDSSAD